MPRYTEERIRLQPGFRNRETGEQVITFGVHDVDQIPAFHGLTADNHFWERAQEREKWEPGFIDQHDRFWDGDEARRTFGQNESTALRDIGVISDYEE